MNFICVHKRLFRGYMGIWDIAPVMEGQTERNMANELRNGLGLTVSEV